MDCQRGDEESVHVDAALMAEAAGGRARIYGSFFEVFVRLPGEALLSDIREGRFDGLLAICGEIGEEKLRDGNRLVASYRSYLADQGPIKVLDELSVDRTRLVGATGDGGPRPPYESLYINGDDRRGGTLARVKDFYRRAGLLPEEGTWEPLDFLFVELDFMKQLCLREMQEWSQAVGGCASRAIQREFLKRHLGSWAGAYCAEAQKFARTDFYRGFLAILDGFLTAERAYLDEED